MQSKKQIKYCDWKIKQDNKQKNKNTKQKNILKQKANKPITKSKNQKSTWETGSKEERKGQEIDK